jgi:hypothetical protein
MWIWLAALAAWTILSAGLALLLGAGIRLRDRALRSEAPFAPLAERRRELTAAVG